MKHSTLHGAALAILCPLIAIGQTSTDAPIDNPMNYVLWNAEVVETVADRLEEELGDKALVWETVGNYAGHSVYLVLRGKTSRAEIHDTESDVQISVRGSAMSIVGGELVGAESLPRKQQRGTSIVGGTRQQLTTGDIMHIPPGVAHQLLIDAAQPYMYLLIKIDEEPLQ
jgi:hypothetical protein